MNTHSKSGYNRRVLTEITVDVVWEKSGLLEDCLPFSCGWWISAHYFVTLCWHFVPIHYVSTTCRLYYIVNQRNNFSTVRIPVLNMYSSGAVDLLLPTALRSGASRENSGLHYDGGGVFLKLSSVWPARLLCGEMTRKTSLSDGDEKKSDCRRSMQPRPSQLTRSNFFPACYSVHPPPPPTTTTKYATYDSEPETLVFFQSHMPILCVHIKWLLPKGA